MFYGDNMTKLKCQLKRPPFYQCCCVCASNVNVVDNDFNLTKKWICTLPLDMGKESWGENERLVVIENHEHSGGCECWNDNRKDKKDETV